MWHGRETTHAKLPEKEQNLNFVQSSIENRDRMKQVSGTGQFVTSRCVMRFCRKNRVWQDLHEFTFYTDFLKFTFMRFEEGTWIDVGPCVLCNTACWFSDKSVLI